MTLHSGENQDKTKTSNLFGFDVLTALTRAVLTTGFDSDERLNAYHRARCPSPRELDYGNAHRADIDGV
eukprot:1193380-Prorocentrum_minimum.AAC.2